MKKSKVLIVVSLILRSLLKFRYRVKVAGFENLTSEKIDPTKGILFLSNHPASMVDPIMVVSTIYKRFTIRPMITDYMYDNPLFQWIFRRLGAYRVHDMSESATAELKEEILQQIDDISKNSKNGDNFLIYPAGEIKSSNREVIGGNSAAHTIVQNNPDINIVLIRIKGLYGSSFSRYWEGKSPNVEEVVVRMAKQLVKNFLFFMPKREVTLEFHLLPADFPRDTPSRKAFNRWLEKWFNRPDGLAVQEGEEPGDSTQLVPYSIWGDAFPERCSAKKSGDAVDISCVEKETVDKIVEIIAEIAQVDREEITLSMDLRRDLCLDSLEIFDLSTHLMAEFSLEKLPLSTFTTVEKVIAIAAIPTASSSNRETLTR